MGPHGLIAIKLIHWFSSTAVRALVILAPQHDLSVFLPQTAHCYIHAAALVAEYLKRQGNGSVFSKKLFLSVDSYENHFPVILFTMLYNVVLTCETGNEIRIDVQDVNFVMQIVSLKVNVKENLAYF